MTIGSLPMACTEIGTEFSTAVPFTLANGTLLGLGGLSVPYSVSSWSGKTASLVTTITSAASDQGNDVWTGVAYRTFAYQSSTFGSIANRVFRGYNIDVVATDDFYDPDGPVTGQDIVFGIAAPNLGASFFSSFTVNGTNYTSASMTYSTDGASYSQWTTGNSVTLLPGSGSLALTVYP